MSQDRWFAIVMWLGAAFACAMFFFGSRTLLAEEPVGPWFPRWMSVEDFAFPVKRIETGDGEVLACYQDAYQNWYVAVLPVRVHTDTNQITEARTGTNADRNLCLDGVSGSCHASL